MRRFFTFFNSLQTVIGILYLLLFCFMLYCGIRLVTSDEPLVLRIVGSLVVLISLISILLRVAKHFKKAYDIITNYTFRQREELGDLLFARLAAGEDKGPF